MVKQDKNDGWIKLHRKIRDSWLWEDPVYFKAWIAILLQANHENKNVLIQGELIECKKGQSLLSLNGWVKCFGKKWTIQQVRTFFALLKRDQMIITKGLRKTTRLTVCNYEYYQNTQQADNRLTTGRQQQTRRNKNDKEEEVVKKIKINPWNDDTR